MVKYTIPEKYGTGIVCSNILYFSSGCDGCLSNILIAINIKKEFLDWQIQGAYFSLQ
jgi:hypothetical protein